MKFKPIYINATTLDDAWFQLLSEINKHGRKYKIDNGSYAGQNRLEFDFVSGFINKPHERPLAPRMPESSTLPRPTTDDAIEQYFANYIMDPTLAPGEEYRYSSWINGQLLEYPKYCSYTKCEYFKDIHSIYCCVQEINNILPNKQIITCPLNKPNTQLEWCIDHFKTKGYGNNHCYISVGNKESCLAYNRPYKNEMERGTTPCLRGIDFKIKDGKLITSVIFRSWDLFSGFPENMGGMTLLSEYIVEQLDNVEPGPLAFTSSGLHCYDFQLDVLKQRLGK